MAIWFSLTCREVGATVEAGADCAVAESVKAASDIYAPISGEIVAVNEELNDSPELVNSDPYTDGLDLQDQSQRRSAGCRAAGCRRV
ncbi:glycine cleavage system H protein [Klebsiella pneumoniae]|uniref:Glycine cleavage system H protein n=1 Tax=Klebsiella pneumoniae TaxID=573 RepID=A0A2X1Q588_KLEPN|nr:glycine cleavage system H protein [Klebsiella pneumoniae]